MLSTFALGMRNRAMECLQQLDDHESDVDPSLKLLYSTAAIRINVDSGDFSECERRICALQGSNYNDNIVVLLEAALTFAYKGQKYRSLGFFNKAVRLLIELLAWVCSRNGGATNK